MILFRLLLKKELELKPKVKSADLGNSFTRRFHIKSTLIHRFFQIRYDAVQRVIHFPISSSGGSIKPHQFVIVR